ncbi:extracellular solute-binding protein [Agarivorans sp. MS3-6]|uniref:extracellular solute-binding protein n=1 Tax=Agarivorans sp. TSD2052 TaxID=2937286 RepID=UPI00200F3CBF|nr:extracellular solute-binding protein [Agarivorans sp. TSD2052]UPW18405.1 extracellular solute-binding protein [Agarivorans sp. TSD2052]
MLRFLSVLLLGYITSWHVWAETVDLRVLAWPGYADADVVAEFEQRYQVSVKVSYITSDDDMWLRMAHENGANYDVFAVNTAELQRYIDAGLALSLDLENIPNLANQLPRFRTIKAIPGATRGNAVYAVPYTYSEMGLIYNKDFFSEPPQSWKVLWDPKYQAKILAYNGSAHNYSLAAMALGFDHPFQLTAAQFQQSTQHLLALRRNVLTFYRSPEEALDYFNQESVALVFANYGAQQLKKLEDAGANIGYVIPEEGALAWLDCWVLSSGLQNRELAHQWINFTLEKSVSQLLTERQGLANTIVQDQRSVAEDKIIWLEQVEDQPQRSHFWQNIISGNTLQMMELP